MKQILIGIIIVLLLTGCGVTKKLTTDSTPPKDNRELGIIMGDSIAYALAESNGPDLDYFTGVRWENYAKCGSTTEYFVSCNVFDNEILPRSPKYIIINLGINNILLHKEDIFINDMRYILNRCAQNNIKVYVMGLTQRDNNAETNKLATSLNTQLKEIIPSGSFYLDNYALISGIAANYNDNIHPGNLGREKIVTNFVNIFKK